MSSFTQEQILELKSIIKEVVKDVINEHSNKKYIKKQELIKDINALLEESRKFHITYNKTTYLGDLLDRLEKGITMNNDKLEYIKNTLYIDINQRKKLKEIYNLENELMGYNIIVNRFIDNEFSTSKGIYDPEHDIKILKQRISNAKNKTSKQGGFKSWFKFK